MEKALHWQSFQIQQNPGQDYLAGGSLTAALVGDLSAAPGMIGLVSGETNGAALLLATGFCDWSVSLVEALLAFCAMGLFMMTSV